jgi:DNA invertase Pin-like site-specific DNA recombinase
MSSEPKLQAERIGLAELSSRPCCVSCVRATRLIVTRIDRLARSIKDLQDIVHELKGRGVALKATEQPIDTRSAAGKAFLDMLGVFAEFETNLRRERQLDGIALASVYRGRKPVVDRIAVQHLHATGLKPSAIARQLGIGRASVYRALGES